jgi:hypothetical protein
MDLEEKRSDMDKLRKSKTDSEMLAGSGLSLINSAGAPFETVVERAETVEDEGIHLMMELAHASLLMYLQLLPLEHPVTTRKDWLTTENRAVTTWRDGRQLGETGTGYLGPASRCTASPLEEHQMNSLQKTTH